MARIQWLWVAGVVAALSAAALGQTNRSISGAIFAAPGDRLQGTVVFACLWVNNNCDPNTTYSTVLNTNTDFAGYQLQTGPAGQYVVVAYHDLDNSGGPSIGDNAGFYSSNSQLRLITPPQANVNIQMRSIRSAQDYLEPGAVPGLVQPEAAPPPAVPSPATPPPAPATAKPGPPAARTATLAEFVGEWGTVSVSMIEYYNTLTGSSEPASGGGVSYQFYKDGRFVFASLIHSQLYNCSTKVFLYKEGKFSIKGTKIELKDQKGTLQSWDTCVAKWNYTKPASLKTDLKDYRIGREGNFTALYLGDAAKNDWQRYTKNR